MDYQSLPHLLSTMSNKISEKGILDIKDSNYTENWILYKDLEKKSHKVARALFESGVREKDIIVIAVDDTKNFLEVFWGCLLLKAIPSPVMPLFQSNSHSIDAHRITNILNITKGLLVIDADTPALINTYEDLVNKENLLEMQTIDLMCTVYSEEKICKEYDLDEVAMIQFSSGSTGSPKGACLSHKNILFNIESCVNHMKSNSNDVFMTWMPFHHDLGLFVFHIGALISEANLIKMCPLYFSKNPLGWLKIMSKYKVSFSSTTPSGLKHLMNITDMYLSRGRDIGNMNLNHIKAIFIGAEMIEYKTCQKFNDVFSNFYLRENIFVPGYGLSETTVVSTVCKLNSPLILNKEITIDDPSSTKTFTSVGTALDCCEIRIGKDNKSPHQIEEIFIKGLSVMTTYYEDKLSLTSSPHEEYWFSTGDFGFLDSENNLYIAGRKKEIIIINGHNYFPYDLENKIEEIDINNILKFICFAGFINEDMQEDYALFYTKSAKAIQQDMQQIYEKFYMDNNIPVHKSFEIKLSDIPRTSSGKVIRTILLKKYIKDTNL